MSGGDENSPYGGLLRPGIVEHLVGVIDLQRGQAVHACGGDRARYAPVSHRHVGRQGDPLALAQHYRRLGIGALYIADLDAISGGRLQTEAIHRLLDAQGEHDTVLVDVGWRGDLEGADAPVIADWAARFGQLQVIAASETAGSPAVVARLLDHLPAPQAVVGLDFRDGQLIGRPDDPETWLAEAERLAVAGVVTLDLHAVGSAGGPTTAAICRRLKSRLPAATVYSGGGVRSADDVRALRQSGCDRCLVATALLGDE